jgi:hypothetical protein
MTSQPLDPAELLAHLGYKPLSRTKAKVEILLGLAAGGIGLLLGNWALSQTAAEIAWGLVAGGLALFVFGGYLALAGHRSHLYQSNNELAAFLVSEIHKLKDKGSRE